MNEDAKNIITKKKKVKMRTKIILGVVLGFIVISAYKIISPYYILPREIQELNDNISMDYKFVGSFKEYSFEQVEWTRDDGPNSVFYYNQEGDRWGFEGYPDRGDSLKLTYYDTGNQQDIVFGFRTGDDLKKIDDILKKHRYIMYKDDEKNEYYKGKVSIIIHIDTNIIETDTEERLEKTAQSISIRIKSTDWFHNGYYK